MADEASASSHSNSIRKKFHVFISFRGEDTRKNFTSHLYRAFSDKKINAYIDEESLKKGDEISPALLGAIAESEISVIILSKDYASSRWCLDELNHIVQCRESHNQIVVPVFYGVDPSDVRKQQGSYSTTFAAHEERFKDQMDKVQQWRNSLTKVADLSGFHSSNFRSDSELVKVILEDISTTLHDMIPLDECKDLIGIEKCIQRVELLLNINSTDTRIVGIWGMGGIGKTTLAEVIFRRFAYQFEGHWFLKNVKEESKRHGLDRLQKKLFSNLLSEEKELNMISQFIKDRLRHTKVLIVLDDVDNVNQLEFLANDRDWFGPGSKIIITSRDMHVLKTIEVDGIYEVEELNSDDSLQLFCSKAFRLSSPPRDYLDLSQRMVHYAKGIPLVLKVLGGHLYKKSIKQWESELDKLKKIPKNEVYEVLKISYDGLESDEKELFLDIACFFKGHCRDSVERILKSYGTRYVDAVIPILIDKALIIVKRKFLEMHELLQQMGWQIVRQESTNPGERSRLWLAEDVYEVLRYNTGTRSIQGISLEMYQREDDIQLEPRVFEKMYNLKYLKLSIYNGENWLNFPEGLKSLPDELRYLSWDYYPLKSLPSKFNPCNLIELDLSDNKLEYLWDGVQNFANLKYLDLSSSKNLIQIPDLSQALKLEHIELLDCLCLENLPSSISKLESLQDLNLYYCQNFNKFPELPVNIISFDIGATSIEQVPSSIGRLFHLQNLSLKYCSRLECLPEIPKHLTYVSMRGSGIRKLPSSIENLTRLTSLDLSECKKLESLPHALSTDLLSWNSVNLDRTNVSEIPDWLFRLPVLHELHLCETGIRTIPASIKHSKLRRLYIKYCKSLEYLPELPVSIRVVDARRCTSLQKILHASIDTQSLSISETLTAFEEEPWRYYEYYRETLRFDRCLRLDHNNIIFEFQIRALRLNFLPQPKKVKILKSHCSIDKRCVCISFSGDEIPKWFNYQNDHGSSILFPPQCYEKTNFMGFASCVVVAPKLIRELISNLQLFTLNCDVTVQTNNGQK